MAISAVADANPREAVAVDTFPDGGETSMSNEQPAEEIAAVTNISTDGLLHDLLRPRALSVLQASESDQLAVSCGVGEEPLALGTRCRLPAVQQPLAMSDLAVVNILRLWKNKVDVPTFVHQLDLYACPPWEVVKGLEDAPRVTTKNDKGEKTWFIIGSEYGERHGRKVGRGRGTWHGEGGAHPILGADGKSVVAYKKRFSYKKRTPGKSGKQQRTGWIMMQISLAKDTEGADQNHQTVICMIYKSNHKYAAAAAAETSSTAASSYAGALTKGKAVALAVAEEALLDGREKAAATELSLIDLLLKAAGKAVYYGDFKNACQIPEFEAAKKMCRTTIHELGLDRSVLSDPFSRLGLHLQHVAMTKELTPNERDHIVCLGKRMSATIFSEYLNELGKRARQAFNALDQRLGVNVQEALQRASKMTNVSLVVHDSEAKDSVQFLLSAFLEFGFASKVEEAAAENNKRPIPASFTTASGSGIKRKADGGGHAEAPPGLHQARTETCPTLVDPVGMPGVADNPEDPVGVHGFPAGVVAPQVEADHYWADFLNGLQDDDAWPAAKTTTRI